MQERVGLPQHEPDCPGENLESYAATGPTGEHQVTRCIGCGAQRTDAPAEEPLVYGSDEWVEAWRNNKSRITRHLSDREKFDPTLNPLHPNAESWPEQSLKGAH